LELPLIDVSSLVDKDAL
jgi:isopenicillin N synthase-like dioxygenase